MLAALLLSQVLWSTPVSEWREAEVVSIARAGGLVIVEDGRHGVSALDLADGGLRWFVQLDGPLSHAPGRARGTLAFATGTRLLVVDERSGERRLDVDIERRSLRSPVSDGELVYAATVPDDLVLAHVMPAGGLAWRYRAPAAVSAPLVVLPSGDLLAALDDGTLRALPGGRGPPTREAWSRRTGVVIGRLVVDGELLLMSTNEQAVVALSAAGGEVVWRAPLGERLVGVPVVAGDRVVVPTATRAVALQRDDGEIAWEADAAEVPLGPLGDAVLLRGADGSSVLRDQASGDRRPSSLASTALPFGDVVVTLQGSEIVAQR